MPVYKIEFIEKVTYLVHAENRNEAWNAAQEVTGQEIAETYTKSGETFIECNLHNNPYQFAYVVEGGEIKPKEWYPEKVESIMESLNSKQLSLFEE